MLLYLGAEWLVKGAAGLAQAFGVRPLVIGLTVVVYGTSVPELATSLVAARRGQSNLAVGNVVDSNIFNVLLILGAAAVIRPVHVGFGDVWRDPVVHLGMTLVAASLLSSARMLRRGEGALLSVN